METVHDPARQHSSPVCSETISQCLRMVMALTARDLAEPSNQSALRALRDTIDSLLKRHGEATEPRFEPTPASEYRTRPSRYKSNQEKEEKRARLEKREEILRNLRSAVSEFKAEKTADISDTDSSGSAQSKSPMLEKFEIRRQRASFWPYGSKDWARQLLGIEIGMDASEKRQCYLDMVKTCHPDHNQNIAPEAMTMVTAAWEVLR